MKDQMDDRKRFLLKKIKRWEKWSRHLNNESDSRIQKVTTSRYEESFLSGKNEKVESPPKQETNPRGAADMWWKDAKILNLSAQLRDEKDEKMNDCRLKHREQSVPGNGAKKCCRADWHDNAQTGGCHSDPRSLHLSLSPAAKGGSPCEMMRPTVDRLVGRHEIRYKKHSMDLINLADQCLKRLWLKRLLVKWYKNMDHEQ